MAGGNTTVGERQRRQPGPLATLLPWRCSLSGGGSNEKFKPLPTNPHDARVLFQRYSRSSPYSFGQNSISWHPPGTTPEPATRSSRRNTTSSDVYYIISYYYQSIVYFCPKHYNYRVSCTIGALAIERSASPSALVSPVLDRVCRVSSIQECPVASDPMPPRRTDCPPFMMGSSQGGPCCVPAPIWSSIHPRR